MIVWDGGGGGGGGGGEGGDRENVFSDENPQLQLKSISYISDT